MNPAVEIKDETNHPELLELTMEIIENRRKMEEEQQQGNVSSAVEHVDVVEKDSSVVEKGSSVAEKDSSVVEDLDVAEKAQDVEIGAGLDDEEMDPVGKKSSVDSGVDSGAEDGQEDVCPPPSRQRISRRRRDGRKHQAICAGSRVCHLHKAIGKGQEENLQM